MGIKFIALMGLVTLAQANGGFEKVPPLLSRFHQITFSWEGPIGRQVQIAGDFLRWMPRFPMTETRPGHYEITLNEPVLPELHYKFVMDGR